MNEIIQLSPVDLAFAALLILVLAGLSFRLCLGLGKQILISSVRTVIQLTLIGFVLKVIFAHVHIGWMSLMALAMLLAALFQFDEMYFCCYRLRKLAAEGYKG